MGILKKEKAEDMKDFEDNTDHNKLEKIGEEKTFK